MAWGTNYIVDELFIGRKGRETWVTWQCSSGSIHETHMEDKKFRSIEKAQAEITNRQKARRFVPKIVKELEYED